LQKLSEQDRKALVQIAGTIVAAGAGATVGVTTQDAAAAGAAGGLGTQYNWTLHPPVPGPSVPPTPGEPQKPNSTPGKPAYDGDQSILTGTPNQSQQNVLQVIARPALEAIENVGALVGAILPNPLKPVESLGAIFNSSNDSTNGTGQLSSISVEKLSGAGQAIDPADRGGEMTTAGRALQKHGSRPGSAFPQATGNPSQMNEQGQGVLEEILNSPGATVKEGNRFGGIDVVAPDGRGARFDANGGLRGFLEPPQK
jgi:filamentous hemagglutinin